ncbi:MULTISPECIES: sensor histidine kinase [Pseudonocardia]|uniref:histidine kinase n=2 Tax=Pseudonocardia TaxID=1847 RepID=A0A1Y2MUP5_PSEAH|nr:MULTISPECIES: histidine kinase [Pseudonocardia]OSY38904.1 Sensor histidine kinase DesK [Pseudonocardia autotrophica]TDN76160.1 signal transduction histidine kinase [Pseudonocardia autotrophica]BBG00141.1 two-component sensor histidine kinase [Pseudonocardia autotrophica]GEC26106.1 two-component sensor histidine kinase [Pseudonocardia saturnea]
MPTVRDVLVATAVAAVAVAGALLGDPSGRPLLPWGAVLIGVATVALCWRSRFPVPVLVAVMVPTALYYWLDHPDGPASLLVAVAVYTVASRVSWPRAALTGLLVVLAWAGTDLLLVRNPPDPSDHYGWIVVTVALGVAVGAVRRAAELSAEQAEERLALRVEQERLRIARDVHDVVSHSLSMIVVQAGVGAHVAARRPEEAVAALLRIRDAGTDALRELRGTLELLRIDGEPLTGGLDRLDEVVSAGRSAGLEVAVTGDPGPLPESTDRTVFAIVREAVTNTVRHAPVASRVQASITRDAGRLHVHIADDGGPMAHPARPHGQGLRGLAERAEALGGRLRTTAGPDGFVVEADLPDGSGT